MQVASVVVGEGVWYRKGLRNSVEGVSLLLLERDATAFGGG